MKQSDHICKSHTLLHFNPLFFPPVHLFCAVPFSPWAASAGRGKVGSYEPWNGSANSEQQRGGPVVQLSWGQFCMFNAFLISLITILISLPSVLSNLCFTSLVAVCGNGKKLSGTHLIQVMILSQMHSINLCLKQPNPAWWFSTTHVVSAVSGEEVLTGWDLLDIREPLFPCTEKSPC